MRRSTAESGAPEPGRGDWPLRAMALALPLVVVVALDLALGALGAVPPDDPILLHRRARDEGFTPFVSAGNGALEVRADWVSRGDGLEVTRGERAGHFVLHPGFRPSRIAVPKPADELRVFALGGSSTFGLYVGEDAAFPAQLGRHLGERFPGRRIHVVNVGCAGWASDRVAALLESLLALEPDLAVVYAGHNELLAGEPGTGPLDAAHRLHAQLLGASPIFRWLNHAIAPALRARGGTRRSEAWLARAATAFDPLSIPPEARRLPSQPWLDAAAEGYAANLRRAAHAARAAGVPILFAMPVANLAFPPMASAHAEGFAEREAFELDLAAARSALARRDGAAALASLDHAVAASPRHAGARYGRALALADLGRGVEAAVELQHALDADVRAHRITSQLEAAFLGAMQDTGARWVDPRPQLRGELSLEAARTLFVDHVHPTQAGHARLAAALAPAAADLLASERLAAHAGR